MSAGPAFPSRAVAARLLLVLAGVALVVAVVAGYGWRAVGSSGQAARRAADGLQQPAVRRVVSERAADAIVRAHPDLISARALIAATVSGLAGTDAFSALVRKGVRDTHAAVFDRDQGTVTLTLVDVGVLAAAALRKVAPDVADRLDHPALVSVLNEGSSATAAAVALVRNLRLIALIAAAVALAAAAASVALRRDRRAAVTGLGWMLALAGVAVVLLQVAGGLVVARIPAEEDTRAATRALWGAFTGDLRSLGWLLLAVGLIVIAVATSRLRAVPVERVLVRGWRRVTAEPAAGWARVARGIALLALAFMVFAAPAATATLAIRLVALYVGYKGLEAVLLVVQPSPMEPEARRGGLARGLAAAVVVAAAVALAVVALRPDRAVSAAAVARPAGCNGHAALCGRALTDVALPATHNSMSAPLPGWSAAIQERGIPRQLDDGIRGLLIDSHYGERLANGRVRTEFESPADLTAALHDDPVSEAALAAAQRLRERAGFRGKGERGLFLCHTFCELGATPLADTLDVVHEFLVSHPEDVLVIVNQDHVTPADFVGAIRKAGLERFAITPPHGDWPTLRELVDSDRRLLVMAENEAGAAPWYQLAYERLLEETPFTFSAPRALTYPALLAASCRSERGPAGAPLFLLNHWVNTDPTPLPSNAARVNTRAAILARARACERLRGREPNLVAVDFYRTGDVFGAVDALNGIRR